MISHVASHVVEPEYLACEFERHHRGTLGPMSRHQLVQPVHPHQVVAQRGPRRLFRGTGHHDRVEHPVRRHRAETGAHKTLSHLVSGEVRVAVTGRGLFVHDIQEPGRHGRPFGKVVQHEPAPGPQHSPRLVGHLLSLRLRYVVAAVCEEHTVDASRTEHLPLGTLPDRRNTCRPRTSDHERGRVTGDDRRVGHVGTQADPVEQPIAAQQVHNDRPIVARWADHQGHEVPDTDDPRLRVCLLGVDVTFASAAMPRGTEVVALPISGQAEGAFLVDQRVHVRPGLS